MLQCLVIVYFCKARCPPLLPRHLVSFCWQMLSLRFSGIFLFTTFILLSIPSHLGLVLCQHYYNKVVALFPVHTSCRDSQLPISSFARSNSMKPANCTIYPVRVTDDDFPTSALPTGSHTHALTKRSELQ